MLLMQITVIKQLWKEVSDALRELVLSQRQIEDFYK